MWPKRQRATLIPSLPHEAPLPRSNEPAITTSDWSSFRDRCFSSRWRESTPRPQRAHAKPSCRTARHQAGLSTRPDVTRGRRRTSRALYSVVVVTLTGSFGSPSGSFPAAIVALPWRPAFDPLPLSVFASVIVLWLQAIVAPCVGHVIVPLPSQLPLSAAGTLPVHSMKKVAKTVPLVGSMTTEWRSATVPSPFSLSVTTIVWPLISLVLTTPTAPFSFSRTTQPWPAGALTITPLKVSPLASDAALARISVPT